MMIREKTTIAAHGRWREILPALGIPTDFLTGKKQPCLFCGGIDRARFDDRNHDGGYFCNQCGPGNGIKLLMQFHGWDYARAAQEVDKIIGNLPPRGPEFHTTQAANPGACRRMYAASCPVEDGDPVGRYLINRGLAPLQWPRTLRYIEELRHKPSGTVQHGMLAVFSDAHGKPATIHRTFLTGDGCKADVDPVRMFMPGNMPVGGAIRLRDAAEMM
jgi:putative DNA primase/helicase